MTGGEGRLPTFLIIGAPKAGTTSLASYLSAHPDVFMSEEKELHYFDADDRGERWYRAQFAGGDDARAVGEATPTYLYRERALKRMAQMVPEAKLIVIMRNPVDRAYSHYWWTRAINERRDFATAVREEMAEGPSDVPLNWDGDTGRESTYTVVGRYLEALERACRYYPRAALLPVVLEDLRDDPTHLYPEICRFIGVDDTVSPDLLGSVMNPAYRVRSERLRRAMLRYKAWKRLPFGLADRIDRANRTTFEYPKMDPAIRQELLEWFEPANTALAAWLGRELDVWRR
jgi:hypothetical protein